MSLVRQQVNRLPTGGRIDRKRPLVFRFGNHWYEGFQGDTIASALLANGVDVVGRSFKYARPRGILAAGVDEPNAIVQVGGREARQTPNVRATTEPLSDDLVCHAVNGWPSARFDLMGLVGKIAGHAMGPGFYYKTFMFPAFAWKGYEAMIRRAAGLGRSARLPDPDRYDHWHQQVEVLIVGAGPAGLAAALAASEGDQRVLLVDEQFEPGGALSYSSGTIDGRPASDWVATAVATLDARDNVTRLARATVSGAHDHHFFTIHERAPAAGSRLPVRERLHKVRAGQLVLATGAHERPIVFANNDLPGCLLASAVSSYIHRFAVVPGQRLVLATANDRGYQCAFDWQDAGREVVAIVDARAAPDGAVVAEAARRGLAVRTGSVVSQAHGRQRVSAALVCPIDASAQFVAGQGVVLGCDTIATSGGWSPVVHLSSHTGRKPVWDEAVLGFVPAPGDARTHFAGSLTGRHGLAECLASGWQAGQVASGVKRAVKRDASTTPTAPWQVPPMPEGKPMALFLAPHPKPVNRAPGQFVDFQNDVTAAAIHTATQEGFESIEHVKRYTALGFGNDQGKTGNVNGLAIAARVTGRSIAQTGTTVFRPNYTPVSFGAVAGAHVNELFDPERYTPLHAWHVQRGAAFEPVGQWLRPLCYPRGAESVAQATARECLAARETVGMLDASTLGKIDIQGPDARTLLERVYTNGWKTLKPGYCRYGLMCGEDGMVMDDGVSSCLNDEHFLMSTTSGGAAHVLSHLELFLQTEWPELDVYLTSVTDHFATVSLAGPDSRQLLQTVCDDIDLSPGAFGFMQWRQGLVAGFPARVSRISFTGDLSYEITVAAPHAQAVWDALWAQGQGFNLTPYGTEAMHVLRAEKGFVIVGQDTDGSVTPLDLDHAWAVKMDKAEDWIGRRGLLRSDCQRAGRKQLVGLRTRDPAVVLPEGAQAVVDPSRSAPVPMHGHVSSSYYSPVLGHSIAMALIKDGLSRMGEELHFPLADGRVIAATICSRVFFDAEGGRAKS